MVLGDLYWMKVSIIPAVVVVDSVVAVVEFVISAAPSMWYVGLEVAYFGGWKEILYFVTWI